MDDKDKMSLIAKLLDEHKRFYPHHSHLCELCKEAEAAIAAPAAPLPAQPEQSDELHFNAQRLRNVAKLVGLESAVPQDDATLDGARGSVLGQIARKLREGQSGSIRPSAEPAGKLDAGSTTTVTAEDVRMLHTVASFMRRHESPRCADDLTRLALKLEAPAEAPDTTNHTPAPLPELTGPSLTDKEKQQRNIMLGMADCMDMVRNDLIEMGIIDKSVAPMFIPEAIASYCKRLAASPSPAPAQQQEPSIDQRDAARYRYMRGCCERNDVPGIVVEAQTGAQLDHAIDAAIKESSESAETAAPGASTEDKQ